MTSYTLARTGDAPLTFEGEHLAGISIERISGRNRNRWHEIDLYRTRAGRYVLTIAYRTLWQGEHDTRRAIPCDTPGGVREELRAFDPLADVGGYPPGDAYRDKQERLERTIRLDWAEGVRELFAALDAAEFAEVIE